MERNRKLRGIEEGFEGISVSQLSVFDLFLNAVYKLGQEWNFPFLFRERFVRAHDAYTEIAQHGKTPDAKGQEVEPCIRSKQP